MIEGERKIRACQKSKIRKIGGKSAEYYYECLGKMLGVS
jgi:hypothetical protein